MPVPTISIAMATFNGGRFLHKQLETLAQQTLPPSELVISDDGSTDDTIAIATAFAESAPFPVRIRQNPARTGYRANFTNAALLCSSELIAFCDQDDVWHEQKLADVIKPFDDSSVLLVHHNARIIDRNEMPVGPLLPPGVHAPISDPLTTNPWVFALGFCQVFRRSLLDFSSHRAQSIDFFFPTEQLAHDQWFFFLASVLGRIAYLPRQLVDYRQHGGNAYGVRSNRLVRSFTQLREKLNNSGSYYEHLAAVARNRVVILDHIAATQSAAWERANAGAERYRKLAERLEQRAGIYRQPWFVDRLSQWLRLLHSDAYEAAPPWSFDRKSAMRDALLGILLGPTIELIKTKMDRHHIGSRTAS